MPTLDPARAGLTNTGSPSWSTLDPAHRLTAADHGVRRRPRGRRPRSIFLVNSLSMAAALASTPDPT